MWADSLEQIEFSRNQEVVTEMKKHKEGQLEPSASLQERDWPVGNHLLPLRLWEEPWVGVMSPFKNKKILN